MHPIPENECRQFSQCKDVLILLLKHAVNCLKFRTQKKATQTSGDN